MKCKDIQEYHFGEYDIKVGDCLYNLALAYKKHLLLPPAQSYMEQALRVYQEGVGLKSMPVANTLLALGKISLI